MDLSILILTIPERDALYQRLRRKLAGQVADHKLERHVEVMTYLDNHEHSIGEKRNTLVTRATGAFVVFVDDDDDVSDQYVPLIHQTIVNNPAIDCIGIRGVVTFQGRRARPLVFSAQYNSIFSRDQTYYRPILPINPIRRDIVLRYPFADVGYSEDFDFGMRMARAGVLRNEVLLDEPLYFYYSRRSPVVQALLDATEFIRHPLGLQAANRLRISRWILAQAHTASAAIRKATTNFV